MVQIRPRISRAHSLVLCQAASAPSSGLHSCQAASAPSSGLHSCQAASAPSSGLKQAQSSGAPIHGAAANTRLLRSQGASVPLPARAILLVLLLKGLPIHQVYYSLPIWPPTRPYLDPVFGYAPHRGGGSMHATGARVGLQGLSHSLRGVPCSSRLALLSHVTSTLTCWAHSPTCERRRSQDQPSWWVAAAARLQNASGMS